MEQRVRELEAQLVQKNQLIQELKAALTKGGMHLPSGVQDTKKARDRVSGFQKVHNSEPLVRYEVVDQDDPIETRLEAFYNSTGSSIQFYRINQGFYRFGETIVALDIINHKLMARTEDGWNRGKFGAIERFLAQYENIEREKVVHRPVY